jgi:integrase/recombinase XerD
VDFADTVAEYLTDCRRRGLRPATLRYYEMVLASFGQAAGVASLEQIDLARVRTFQDRSPQLSSGSMRGFLRALHTFVLWALEQDLLAADPLARLRLPRADRRIIAVPTDQELISLLAASNPTLRTVIATLAATGLRVSDTVGLSLTDLRPRELLVGRSKNRSGRIVPIDEVLAGLLTLYVKQVRSPTSTSLLVSRSGRRLSADAIRHVLADTVREAGVTIRVSPHVLRHWHARDLAAHNTSDRLLAARMGWRTQGLIARYAPVGQAELEADTRRYSPLVRLRNAGLLNGLFPGSVLAASAQRSKYVGGRASGSRLPDREWLRQS